MPSPVPANPRSSHPYRRLSTILCLALLAVLLLAPVAQSAPVVRFFYEGSLDTTYNSLFGPNNGASGHVEAVALQNGKAIIGGDFLTYQGVAHPAVARLNLDGSLDASFGSPIASSHSVSTICVQGDNKILVGGAFPGGNIARLDAGNGSLDTSFNPGGAGAQGDVYTIAVQTDGKIVIGGDFGYFNTQVRPYLARVNSQGTLDTFNTSAAAQPNNRVHVVALQSDGSILIGGYFDEVGQAINKADYRHLARLTAAGSLDSSFNPTTSAGSVGGLYDAVNDLKVLEDGKILVAGNFPTFQGSDLGGIVRVDGSGKLDPAFNTGGVGTNGSVKSILVQPDGKILISGLFTEYNHVLRQNIARLYPNGTLDLSFDPGAGPSGSISVETINGMARQADGKIVIGGDFYNYDGTPRNAVARLNGFGQFLYVPRLLR